MATAIPNPFGTTINPPSPIAESIRKLSGTLLRPPVDTSGIESRRAAAAHNQAKTDALRNQQRALSGIGQMVANAVSGPLPEAPRPDPNFKGPLPAISRTDHFQNQVPELTQTGLQAGFNPTQLGRLVFSAAKQAGLPADISQRFRAELIPLNQGIDLADRDKLISTNADNAVALAQSKPVNTAAGGTTTFAPGDPRARGQAQITGQPTLATTRGQVAQDAVDNNAITPVQQRVLGGSRGTPRNYIATDGRRGVTLDGTTDAATGAAIPQGSTVFTGQLQGGNVGDLTKSTQSGIQKDTLAAGRFKTLLGQTREIAQRDPTNFGVPGFIKGVAQDTTALAEGVATGLGYTGTQEAVQDVRNKIARNSEIDPSLFSGVFDPNLPALQTLADLLVFSAAETLAGQSGKSVSDRDVKLFKSIAGDPQSWLMSQEKYLAKLQVMEDIINARVGATEDFVNQSGGSRSNGSSRVPPEEAVDALRADPRLKDQFIEFYGEDAYRRATGQ